MRILGKLLVALSLLLSFGTPAGVDAEVVPVAVLQVVADVLTVLCACARLSARLSFDVVGQTGEHATVLRRQYRCGKQ